MIEQTNLDEICLEEIKTNTMERSETSKRTSRVIHFSDGNSIEVDENDNYMDDCKKENKVGIRPKRLKLFQLISSPIDHFATNKFVNLGSTIGRKTLRTVDHLGESIAGMVGILDSKFSNEINSGKQRTTN